MLSPLRYLIIGALSLFGPLGLSPSEASAATATLKECRKEYQPFLASPAFPPVIPYLARQKEYPNARAQGGKVLGEGESFSIADVASGRYVYLIARDGNEALVVWSLEAVPDSSNRTNLVTHTSLTAELKSQLGREPVVVGAGEVKIENGRVQILNNRAGTRRGSQEHLDFSEQLLRSRGLAVEAKTERRDYSAEEDRGIRHFEASERATHLWRVENDLTFDVLKTGLRRIQTWLYAAGEAYRDPEIPGRLNSKWICDIPRLEKKWNRKFTPEEIRLLINLEQYLHYSNRDGLDFVAIRAGEDNLPIAEFLAAYRLVKP